MIIIIIIIVIIMVMMIKMINHMTMKMVTMRVVAGDDLEASDGEESPIFEDFQTENSTG